MWDEQQVDELASACADREACLPGSYVSTATCIPEMTVETKLSASRTISLISECSDKRKDRCAGVL
jgi:hypothetical protein